MEKCALSIWQSDQRKAILRDVTLADRRGGCLSKCLVILYLITACVNKNQRSSLLYSNDYVTENDKKIIFQYTAKNEQAQQKT